MNNYTYEVIQNTPEGCIPIIKKIDSTGAISWIPKDPGNSDYQEYLKSLEV